MEDADGGGSEGGDLRDAMRMSREERAAFLREHGVGVLSLARDDESYAFPVSYGYDGSEETICLMLAFAPESRKRRWIEATETATFVVHEIEDTGEAGSVVVRGRLVEAEDDAVCYDAFSDNADFTVLHESGAFIEDTDFVVYRFETETVEGRRFEHDLGRSNLAAENAPSSTQD